MNSFLSKVIICICNNNLCIAFAGNNVRLATMLFMRHSDLELSGKERRTEVIEMIEFSKEGQW